MKVIIGVGAGKSELNASELKRSSSVVLRDLRSPFLLDS